MSNTNINDINPNLDRELQQIDAALARACDALESDSDFDSRRAAFEQIQELYEPGRLMCEIARVRLTTPAAPTANSRLVLEPNDRVYHRHKDLFGKVVSVAFSSVYGEMVAFVKYEPPWDQRLPAYGVPFSELRPANQIE
jgi:hypothetical protein